MCQSVTCQASGQPHASGRILNIFWLGGNQGYTNGSLHVFPPCCRLLFQNSEKKTNFTANSMFSTTSAGHFVVWFPHSAAMSCLLPPLIWTGIVISICRWISSQFIFLFVCENCFMRFCIQFYTLIEPSKYSRWFYSSWSRRNLQKIWKTGYREMWELFYFISSGFNWNVLGLILDWG